MIEGAIHRRNIEPCCWASPLVWYPCDCQTLSKEHNSKRAEKRWIRQQNRGFKRKVKRRHQDKNLRENCTNWANSVCTTTQRTHISHKGEIMKNTFLLICIQNLWSECRHVFSCAPQLEDTWGCLCKAPSRGAFVLVSIRLISWFTHQSCYKAENFILLFYYFKLKLFSAIRMTYVEYGIIHRETNITRRLMYFSKTFTSNVK